MQVSEEEGTNVGSRVRASFPLMERLIVAAPVCLFGFVVPAAYLGPRIFRCGRSDYNQGPIPAESLTPLSLRGLIGRWKCKKKRIEHMLGVYRDTGSGLAIQHPACSGTGHGFNRPRFLETGSEAINR